MGVLYGKHIGDETRRKIEKTYLYDIGIDCACIPIEYRKASNLVLLMGVLTTTAEVARARRPASRGRLGPERSTQIPTRGVIAAIAAA